MCSKNHFIDAGRHATVLGPSVTSDVAGAELLLLLALPLASATASSMADGGEGEGGGGMVEEMEATWKGGGRAQGESEERIRRKCERVETMWAAEAEWDG